MSEETTSPDLAGTNRTMLMFKISGALLFLHFIFMQLYPTPSSYGTVFYLPVRLFSIPYIVIVAIIALIFGVTLGLYIKNRGYPILGFVLFLAVPVVCAGTFLPVLNFEHVDSARLGASVYHVGCPPAGPVILGRGEQAYCNLYKCDPLGAICKVVFKNFGPPEYLSWERYDNLFLVTERNLVQVAYQDKRRVIYTYTP